MSYRRRPDKHVRHQIALMNEILGLKEPINFEEIEKLEKMKEAQRKMDQRNQRKKKGGAWGVDEGILKSREPSLQESPNSGSMRRRTSESRSSGGSNDSRNSGGMLDSDTIQKMKLRLEKKN